MAFALCFVVSGNDCACFLSSVCVCSNSAWARVVDERTCCVVSLKLLVKPESWLATCSSCRGCSPSRSTKREGPLVDHERAFARVTHPVAQRVTVLGPPLQIHVIVRCMAEPCGIASSPVWTEMPGA